MNRRIMKSIMSNKFNKFVESIKDEEVKELVKRNTIITGGAIASMCLKEEINDFDLYFTDGPTTLAVAKYYVGEFNKLHETKNSHGKTSVAYVYTSLNNNINYLKTKKNENIDEDEDYYNECHYNLEAPFDRVRIMIKSAGIVGENTDESQYQYFESRPLEEGEVYVDQAINGGNAFIEADELDGTILEDDKKTPFRPVFLTDNAITLSDKVQLIIRFFGDADTIHENYDFAHCTSYWESKNKNLVLRPDAMEALLARELIYVGSKYPVCSMIRIRKFIKKGWHINAGQMLKIAMQISELNLTDIDVLEDQLTGVDTAYFIQAISHLKEKHSEDPNFSIDTPYLITVIDRIFG